MINQSLFNEAVYLAKNPLVAKAITEGKYPSGYEEYLQVGQFQERSGVIFEGTNGSDTVQSSGQKSSVIGVKVESAEVGSRLINAKTSSLGVGEIDTLLGSPGRNIFYLGDNAKDTPADFYLGNGDKDYGIIRNFDPTSEDAIYLAGNPKDYTFTTIDGSVNISKNGDLIGIVEGVAQLFPDGLFTEKGLLLFGLQSSYFASRTQPYFNEPAYIAANPDVKQLIEEKKYTSGWDHFIKAGLAEGRQTFFNGKVGNDSFFYPLGDATVSGVPITEYDPITKTVKTATLASGDRDHYHGSYGKDRFLLSSGGQDHYVGQGDKDYTLIGDFDRAKDQLLLSKDIEEYKLDIYDDNFNGVIYKEFQLSTKDGDAIVRIEDGETLQLAQIPSEVADTKAFVSTEYEGFKFDEDIYLEFTPDAVKAIADGKYKSGLEYYTQVGQITKNEAGELGEGFFTGTSGNDSIFGFGGRNGLSGVGLTAGDAKLGTLTFDSLGVGEVDILFGSKGENNFLVSTFSNAASSTIAQPLYVGTGDKDYADIRDFDLKKDSVLLAGKASDYVLKDVDGNTQISTNGDLIAIVKGIASNHLKLGTADPTFGVLQVKGDLTPTQDFMKSDGLIDIKIQDGQNIKVSLTNPESEAAFSNTVGFYRVQDAGGTVIDPTDNKSYKPGDAGYALAAVRSSQGANSGVSFGIKGIATPSVDLAGGYFYAPFLVVNSTIDKVLNASAGNIPEVFFKFGAANSDGISHVKMLDANTIGFEDLKGGGDLDFNDAVFKVNTALIV
jgi:Domain of unknown function (DUF4114)